MLKLEKCRDKHGSPKVRAHVRREFRSLVKEKPKTRKKPFLVSKPIQLLLDS